MPSFKWVDVLDVFNFFDSHSQNSSKGRISGSSAPPSSKTEVFNTEAGERWDGTHEGKPVPTGVYLYSITITGENGRKKSYEGSVSVVR